MAKRPSFERSETDIKRGTVGWTDDAERLKQAASIATYRGNGKHKTYKSKTKEWVIAPKSDAAKCDKFADSDWPKLQTLLREAIRAGCCGGPAENRFPMRVWAFVNNVLHEARLTNPESGEYHAFPLDYKEHHPFDRKKKLKDAPRAVLTSI